MVVFHLNSTAFIFPPNQELFLSLDSNDCDFRHMLRDKILKIPVSRIEGGDSKPLEEFIVGKPIYFYAENGAFLQASDVEFYQELKSPVNIFVEEREFQKSIDFIYAKSRANVDWVDRLAKVRASIDRGEGTTVLLDLRREIEFEIRQNPDWSSSSKEDHVAWFAGLRRKITDKEYYMKCCFNRRLKHYHLSKNKMKSFIERYNERNDIKLNERMSLEEMLTEIDRIHNQLEKIHSEQCRLGKKSPFNRPGPPAPDGSSTEDGAQSLSFCDHTGQMFCGKVCKSDGSFRSQSEFNCQLQHGINPYRTRLELMLFELFELDHMISQAKIKETICKLIDQGHQIKGIKYLYELLYTPYNMNLLFRPCHERNAHPEHDVDEAKLLNSDEWDII